MADVSSSPSSARPLRRACHGAIGRPPGRQHWRRDLVGLAALFTTVTAVGALGQAVLGGPDGPVSLIGSAVVLVVTAAAHTWWSRRYEHTPPPPDTTTINSAKATTRYAMGRQSSTAEGEPADHRSERRPPAPDSALWRMRTTVVDQPGALATLCTTLAHHEVDILALQTHPLGGTTVDEFLLRAPGGLGRTELVAAVTGSGGSDIWLERANTHDLVDTPTKVLGMATRTALDTSELPLALRELLGRSQIRSVPAVRGGGGAPSQDVPPEGHFEETVIRLPDPAGGSIVIERAHPPFTPTEFARARALVALDARLGQRVSRRREPLGLPAGGSITVRRADARDVSAAKAMHQRCSVQTLTRRYHGPVGDADRYLRHLLSPRFGRTLAVENAAGRLVALGHLLWDGEETEVALIVEDEWQGRGIGAELLRRLTALALEARAENIYAVTQAGNTAMIATMRGLGLPLDYQFEEGTVVISAPLAPAAAPAQQSR